MTTTHPFWIILATLVIALMPIVVGVATSYIKVTVVLGLLKSGIGAQQVPGTVVVMALACAITMYVMGPTIDETVTRARGINFEALAREPSTENIRALGPLLEPWKNFMESHVGERERQAFTALRSSDKSGSSSEGELLSMRELVPAFVLSELKESFAMGFVLLLPFLVIDLIVANVLAGMGMFMVSPAMISLPLKLILFVVADGWLLLTRGLIVSYQQMG